MYFTFHKTIGYVWNDEHDEHNEDNDDIENYDEYKYPSLRCTDKYKKYGIKLNILSNRKMMIM